MSTKLRDLLTRLTVPDLKDLVSHLPGAATAGRKEELIERIVAAMLGPKLPGIWSSLDEAQQAAVAEAAHDIAGEYSEQRFRAKYQGIPAFSVAGAKSHGYSGEKRSALRLFIHYERDERRYLIPTDLRDRLKALVPPPAPAKLNSSEVLEDPESLIVRQTEREALLEVVVMLRTVEQARVSVSEKTALPSTSALRFLSEKLVGGDFYPWVPKNDKWDQEIGPIKAFAWPMLLQAGALAIRSGGQLALSPAGVKALRNPPADVLRGLWNKWLKSTILDEFSRIDAIKGQASKGRVMTAVAPRRAAIDVALRACPIGRWVTLTEFSRFMRASDLSFEVTHDPWKLYIAERQYGTLGYDGAHGWEILQDRYISALLFEYAATLGMLDIAYRDPAGARDDYGLMWGTDDLAFLSRYDGMHSFRLTPLGAYLLGIETAHRPVALMSNVALSVMPSLQVNVVRGTLGPEEALLLENWAVAEPPQSWRLDSEKALCAIEKGHDIEELRDFLQTRDDLPMPEPVEAFLRLCARNGKALKTGASAVLIECRDEEAADTIAGHEETASLCLRAGPRTLAVRTDQMDRFRQRVRLLGFGMAA
jgi:hypothetical protein